jgi:hypothetical protein
VLALAITANQVQVAIIFSPGDIKSNVKDGSHYGLPDACLIRMKLYGIHKKSLWEIPSSGDTPYVTHLHNIKMDDTYVNLLRNDIMGPVQGLLGPPPQDTHHGAINNSHRTGQSRRRRRGNNS